MKKIADSALLAARVHGDPEWRDATLEFNTAGSVLGFDHRRYSREYLCYANGEIDAYATVAKIAQDAKADGVGIRGCVNCLRFAFSGLSSQFSEGQAGYCRLVGFRHLQAIVRIDFGCGEHEAAENWPTDLEAVFRERLDLAEREPLPARTNAFQGCMVGLAVGDALGYPTEFLSREAIVARYGARGLTDFSSVSNSFPVGTYSDDTQMSIAVAEGLLARDSIEGDSVMESIARRFVQWSTSPENNRSPGRTCMEGCSRLAAGVHWSKAGVQQSKGCGSAMRVAPIGLLFWKDRATLLEVARSSAMLTHGHRAAIESAAAAALLVAYATSKRTPLEMFEAVLEECAPGSPDLKKAFQRLKEMLDVEPSHALSSTGIGEGWVAEEAVAAALYCFWRSPLDYKKTVLTAANSNGDSDSIACIAGAISGAFNGLESIPQRWREGVENTALLHDLGLRLWEKSRKLNSRGTVQP